MYGQGQMVRPEDLEELLRKQSSKSLVGLDPAAPVSNLEINATMSGVTPDGGINNVPAVMAELETSEAGGDAMAENMGKGGLSFDPNKFAANMAAMPGLSSPELAPLPQARPMGYQPMQSGQIPAALGSAMDNTGLMELIKKAQQMGRM